MDQVVCIVDSWNGRDWGTYVDRIMPACCPKKGGIYTIKGINDHPRFPGYFFYEFPGENAWDVRAFRPVKRTSIDLFRKLLVPTPNKREPVSCWKSETAASGEGRMSLRPTIEKSGDDSFQERLRLGLDYLRHRSPSLFRFVIRHQSLLR